GGGGTAGRARLAAAASSLRTAPARTGHEADPCGVDRDSPAPGAFARLAPGRGTTRQTRAPAAAHRREQAVHEYRPGGPGPWSISLRSWSPTQKGDFAMELRKEEKSPAELKDPKENSRFQVVKLEERVAPSCNPAVFITP